MSNIDLASYNRQGKLFNTANLAAASHIAVTTAMTGLILHNPAGSNKKLLVAHAGFVWTTVPGAVHNIGLAFAPPNATALSSLTAVTVYNADGSGASANSVARAYNAATFAVAPVIYRWIGGAAWGSSVAVSPFQISEYIDGSLILIPGATMSTAVVTTTATGMASFSWVEVPA